MNKKLIALAAGATFGALPLITSAGVTVYGHAQVEVATVDDGTTSNTVMEDNARGRIGIKASEKLGNGMTAIAKFEFRTDTADNRRTADGGPLTGREAFVGLKGGFGTVQLGNLKSPYKYTGGVKYDPFVATLIQARGANGMSGGKYGHNGFLSDNVGYMLPKMGAFKAWAVASPDESAGTGGDFSVGAIFGQKTWEIVAAIMHNDTNGAEVDSMKIGGMYKFGNFKIVGQFENLSFDAPGTPDTDIYFVGGQAKFGNNVIVAQFGNTDAGGTSADLDYFTVGLIHNLSKRTRLTAGFRSYETSATAETETFALGMRMKF